MSIWELIGLLASILSACTFLPEVIAALKNKHLYDVAWGMLLLVVSNCALWIIYAVYYGIFPLILSSSLNLIMGAVLIAIKWQSERNLEKVHIRKK